MLLLPAAGSVKASWDLGVSGTAWSVRLGFGTMWHALTCYMGREAPRNVQDTVLCSS